VVAWLDIVACVKIKDSITDFIELSTMPALAPAQVCPKRRSHL
jgi:hypothetical protein